MQKTRLKYFVSILRNTHCMPYSLIVILPRITIKPNSNEQNWI